MALFDRITIIGPGLIGSSLARAALGAFHRAALEIRNEGTFGYGEQALPFAQLNDLFRR